MTRQRASLALLAALAALGPAGACSSSVEQGLEIATGDALAMAGGSGGDRGDASDPDDASEQPPDACDAGTCQRRAQGEGCAGPDDCQSGFCADGVCCNAACVAACVSCRQPGRTGQCLPVEAGGSDPRAICHDEGAGTCGLTGRCNGLGSCARYPAGAMCRASECQAASMVPAGTCDGRGTCLAGAAIACEPYRCQGTACQSACQTDTDCVPPATCMGGSCGKRGLGQSCQKPDDCKSGFCADGVCCSEACTSRCRFCALASSLGRCLEVPAEVPDPRLTRGFTDPALVCVAQLSSSCGISGLCDGAGGCQLFPAGTACQPETCDAAANRYSGPSTCDGGGQCRPGASASCSPYHCAGARCATSCGRDADCAQGRCRGFRCR